MSGFVDEAQLHVKAGDGGAGAVSFRREAHVPRGGPDGGDGGRGGAVWLEASEALASLLSFRDHPHRRAGNGAHGQGKGRHGAAGRDIVVAVPEGTVVRSLDGTVLADLVSAGQRWMAAEPGRGGRGNARFLSNTRRAPGFAEQGERGQERWLNLELKLMADVALVGMPNAGKSTLISRISAAKPKIADYPFTTLEPHLGVVRLPGGAGGPTRGDGADFEMVVADIPGLIEGASVGRGLGHRFLRHVERARVLVVLLDLAQGGDLPPAEQERVLTGELAAYRPELLERPRLVVGSRADLGAPGSAESAAGSGALLSVSSVTGQGIESLVRKLADLVADARRRPSPPVPVVHRPEPETDSVEVRRASGRWVVTGKAAERAVAVSDLHAPGALDHVQRALRRAGVERALARAGARPGDDVEVGGFEFTYADSAGEGLELRAGTR